MRSKHIAALITFFATFAFSTFIALIFATPKLAYVPPVRDYQFKSYSFDNNCRKGNVGSRIEEFLSQDKLNGSEREAAGVTYENGYVSRASLTIFANGVSEYVDQSSSMDDSRFPRDFQKAWREHMSAWNDLAEFLQASKSKRMTFEEFNSRLAAYNDEISSTWDETLRVGNEYGADLPPGF